MCVNYMAVVSHAVTLRENSVPVATARSMADREPERIKTMLRGGRLVQLCAKEARGF